MANSSKGRPASPYGGKPRCSRFTEEAAALDQFAGENAVAAGAFVDFLIDLMTPRPMPARSVAGIIGGSGPHGAVHANSARYR